MGYVLIIISSLLFGIVPSIQSMAQANGAGSSAVVAYCHMCGVATSLISCVMGKKSLKLKKKEALFVGLAALAIFITDLCLSSGYALLPVGVVTMIHFSYPTIVCAIDSLVFKEKFTIKKLISLLLSIAGLILLAGGNISGSFIGILVTMLSAFAYASYVIINDKSASNEVDVNVRVFYFYLVSSSLATISCLINHEPLTFQFNHVSYCIVAGVMLCIGTMLANAGINELGSSKASLFSTLEPVTSMVVSTIIYKYDIALTSIIGCVLIVCSLIPNAIKDEDEDKVKGVIFDFDGVLTDSEVFYVNSVVDFLKELGVNTTFDEVKHVVGQNVRTICMQLKEEFCLNQSVEELIDISNKAANEYASYDMYQPMVGLLDFVKRCKDKGIKLAVASSSGMEYLETLTKQFGVYDDLDFILSGENLEKCKPDPYIYNLAAEKMGFDKKNLIIIEDSVNGIKAGIASGIKTYGLKASQVFQDTSLADKEVYAFSEIEL